MRETCTSGSTRGEVRSLFYSLPLLLYRHLRILVLTPSPTASRSPLSPKGAREEDILVLVGYSRD